MDKKPRSKSPPVEKSYVDASGIPTHVLVPEGETNLEAGIPVSLDISQLYEHMPHDFMVSFTTALHAHGLVKPQDYFVAGASDRYKAAFLDVIRHDFLSIQALAKQELDHFGVK